MLHLQGGSPFPPNSMGSPQGGSREYPKFRRLEAGIIFTFPLPPIFPRILPLKTKRLLRILAGSCEMVADGCVIISILEAIIFQLLMFAKVYLGDSATLSFLQSIRRLVARSLGPSPFTMDSSRHKILEATMSIPPTYRHNYALPDSESALFLVDCFFSSVSWRLGNVTI